MDAEMRRAMDVLRARLSVNKMAAVSAIIFAEEQGDNLRRHLVKMRDARRWLGFEINRIETKKRERASS